MANLFTPNLSNVAEEQFETLLRTQTIHIEKITSHGQVSDKWYEQDRDEWVVVLEGEGELLFEEENRIVHLIKGEHIYIPKMKRHKVIYTSKPTIWLAVHFT